MNNLDPMRPWMGWNFAPGQPIPAHLSAGYDPATGHSDSLRARIARKLETTRGLDARGDGTSRDVSRVYELAGKAVDVVTEETFDEMLKHGSWDGRHRMALKLEAKRLGLIGTHDFQGKPLPGTTPPRATVQEAIIHADIASLDQLLEVAYGVREPGASVSNTKLDELFASYGVTETAKRMKIRLDNNERQARHARRSAPRRMLHAQEEGYATKVAALRVAVEKVAGAVADLRTQGRGREMTGRIDDAYHC